MTKVLNVSFVVSPFSSLLKRPFHILCGDRNDRLLKGILELKLIDRKVVLVCCSTLIVIDIFEFVSLHFSLSLLSHLYIYKTIYSTLAASEGTLLQIVWQWENEFCARRRTSEAPQYIHRMHLNWLADQHGSTNCNIHKARLQGRPI